MVKPESFDNLVFFSALSLAWDFFNNKTIYRGKFMLWTVFIVLILLWLIGIVSSTTLGGFIHVLLIIAIVVILVKIIKGKNPLG